MAKERVRLLEFLALLLLVSVIGTGCGSKEKEEAKAACQKFFEAYTTGDVQGQAELLTGMKETVPITGMQQQMAEKLQFELKKIKKKENTMAVSAVIKAVDLEQTLASLPEDVTSVKAAKKALTNRLKEKELPMKEFEVDVMMVQEKEKWAVQMTRELSNALLGGYYSIMEDAGKEAGL